MQLSELAKSVSIEIVRDGEFNSLGLLSGRNPSMLACLHDPGKAGAWQSSNNLSCVITSTSFAASVPDRLGLAVANAPREAFVDAQRFLGSSSEFYGTRFGTEISIDARVHPGAQVAPHNVRIGSGCVVEAGAVILERVTLDEGCIVRAGATVGAEGFHPVPYGDGIVNMPHHGAVFIGKRVDVGANSVVCRSVFNNPTEIGDETVLGPLAYVAHGVTIGARCRIAASARICGSSTIGERVFIGPNAVVSNLIDVGDGAHVSIGSVVVRDVPAGEKVTGHFALEHGRFMEIWTRLFR